MRVYFNGHDSAQDASIKVSFRKSAVERFSDPNDSGPNGFTSYTGAEIEDFAKKASKPILDGLYRWFNHVTKTFDTELKKRAN